jgi:hypothetical protein
LRIPHNIKAASTAFLACTSTYPNGTSQVGPFPNLFRIQKVPPPPQRERFHTKGIPVNVPGPALRKLKLQRIPAKKGDLIIWRRELAHGNGHNTSSRPRLAQYINMYPARDDDMTKLGPQQSLHPERRFERLQMFEAKLSPYNKPGSTLFEESRDQTPLQLTELGKKLLGDELWQ